MTSPTNSANASARFGIVVGKLAGSLAVIALGDEPVRWLRVYAAIAPVQLVALYAQAKAAFGATIA